MLLVNIQLIISNEFIDNNYDYYLKWFFLATIKRNLNEQLILFRDK